MNNELWLQLHTTALAIAEINNAEAVQITEISSHLDKIEIAYDQIFDPVDCYPEYVATMLCKALGNSLIIIKNTHTSS